MIARVTPWIVLLLIIIIPTLAPEATRSLKDYCLAIVYTDGSVLLEYRLTVDDVPANVTLRVPKDVIFISVWDGGYPAPYSFDDARGLLSFISLHGNVIIRVYTLGLTSKEGIVWRFTLSNVDFEVMVMLPREALIVSVEPGDFNVKLVNGTLSLEFKPGSNIRIDYVLVPEHVITATPITPGAETTIIPIRESGTPVTLLLLALIPTVLLITVGALIALRYRRAGSKLVEVTLEESLDERDKVILETVKTMGEVTAPALQRATRIPKTPLYRKLEKLEKLGLLESEWRGGVKVYRVKEGREVK